MRRWEERRGKVRCRGRRRGDVRRWEERRGKVRCRVGGEEMCHV